MIDLSKEIRKLRKYRKLTTQQVADKVGISRHTYERYERGETYPRLNDFVNIASVLGIAPQDLFCIPKVIKKSIELEAEKKKKLTLENKRLLSDVEYYSKIYCRVFGLKEIDGDMYLNGLKNAMQALLTERQRFVLNEYYRKGLTYKDIGQKYNGVSRQAANITEKAAILKLKNNYHQFELRVSDIKRVM